MSFGNPNGRRPHLKLVIDAPRSKPLMLQRHPYVTAILVVAVAAFSVFIVQSVFKFPPLIIFAGGVVICCLVLGTRPGLLALLLSALVSDFFFVEPVLRLTHHSFVLGMYYLGALGAAVVSLLFTRKLIRH